MKNLLHLSDHFIQQAFLCRILLLCLLGISFNSTGLAQPYYLQGSQIHQYFYQEFNCDTCQFFATADSFPSSAGGISFGPDGDLYILTQAPYNQIHRYNVTSGISSVIYTYPDNTVQMGGLMAMGGGVFYSISSLLEQNDSLFLWDTNADTVYTVGELPYRPYGEMWMANGEVYYLSWQGSGPRRIIRINLSSPEDSDIALEFSADYVIYALTATAVGNVFIGTENSYYYPGKHVVTLNLADGTINKYCRVPKPASHGHLRGLSSMFEHSDVPYLLRVDLDCDDSSGAAGDNFNGNSMDCLTEGSVPITDDDIIMFIDARISTMTISVANPLDDPDEVLTISGGLNGIFAEGEGTSTLTLSSEGEAKISDFIEALKLIRYDNLALNPTAGLRHVEVFFETESGNTCDVATAYIQIEERPQIELDLGPDIDLCEGSTIFLDEGGNQMNYLWSTGETTSGIEIADGGTYSLTVSGGIKCPNSDEVVVNVLPVYHLELMGDSTFCAGEEIVLTVSTDAPFPIDIELSIDPGSNIWYYGITSGFQIIDHPVSFTDYVITSVVSQEPACFNYDLAYQTMEIEEGLFFNDTVSICEGDSILLGMTWENAPGDYTVIHPATDGCDTVVAYTLTLTPAEQEFVWHTTCDTSLAGIEVFWKTNASGCDTMVTNTVIWIPPDTTLLSETSCRQADAGEHLTTLTNQYGCDSIILTSVSWVPPADTTFTTSVTCDSAQTGVYTTYVTGELGCDSLIVHTISAAVPDTTQLFTTSCDSSDLGVFVSHWTTEQHCDSIVITTVSFSAQDSVFINASSCDPGQAGVFVSTYQNQSGCDSIVTLTVTELPPDEVYVHSTTCYPEEAGMFTTTLINQFGCDSVIHSTVELLPQDEVFLFSSTCRSDDAGVFTSTFVNQYGCDSVVTETISLIPADTSYLTEYTCNPTDTATTETIFIGQDGCDSLVIASVALFPLPVLNLEPVIDYNGYSISCEGAADGILHAVVQGSPPYQYLWSEGSTESMISDLGPGTYAVTVTDGNGCTISASVMLNEPESMDIGFEVSEPGCFDQQLGSILVHPVGGVGPFTFSIDNEPFQASAYFDELDEGVYRITVADANDCRAEAFISIHMPLIADVSLGDDHVITLGDSVSIEAVINLPFDSLYWLSWTGIDSSSCLSCLTQIVAPIITSAYFVDVTTIDGCSDRDSLEVLVISDANTYIPNVFSPNGDGVNDEFTFFPGEDVEEILSFSVFDRWGNQLFLVESISPSDPSRAWNGTMHGQHVNPGVFTYTLLLRMTDETTALHYGNITLIR